MDFSQIAGNSVLSVQILIFLMTIYIYMYVYNINNMAIKFGIIIKKECSI